MKTLGEFMEERHSIYLKRQRGEVAPWTDDKVMQDYFFTNVYRELDRTSKVLRSIHGAKMTGNWDCTFLGNVVIHRFISQAEFSAELGYIVNFEDFYNLYGLRRAQGKQVRTRAFTSCQSEEKFINDLRYFWDNSCTLSKAIQDSGRTVKAAYDILLEQPGMGRFMAWQVAQDLEMYGAVAPSDDFVVLGPGAELGLTHTRGDFWELLKDLNEAWPFEQKLKAKDLEHSLCEYAKYVKLNSGGGKKRKYNGKADVHAVPEE